MNKKKNNKWYNFFLFMIGMAASAISISVFYAPNDIMTMGSNGLAILINHYLNIDLSVIVLCISSILLVFSFLAFDSKYGIKNTLGTILFPIFLSAATVITKYVDFGNVSLFLLVIIGGVFSGFGYGLVKRSGYSLGGFYVLYDVISDKFKISSSKANMILNSIILICGIFTFGFSKFIYAILDIYVSYVVSNKIIFGISRNKAFYIVTSKDKIVREYIINNLKHTVTIVNAEGGYSSKSKKLLLCVIPTTEYIKMKEVIREIDNSAFFLITDSYFVSK